MERTGWRCDPTGSGGAMVSVKAECSCTLKAEKNILLISCGTAGLDINYMGRKMAFILCQWRLH